MSPLAQITSRRISGENAKSILPAPETPAQAVGYFIGGAILLALVFAAVIWFKRRDS